jgi:cell wall-associated NlpC family hydrolase
MGIAASLSAWTHVYGRRHVWLGLGFVGFGLGCGTPTVDDPGSTGSTSETVAVEPNCPTTQIREHRAPDIRPEHEDPVFWLDRLGPAVADAELLDAAARAALDTRVAEVDGGWRDPLGDGLDDPARIDAELAERVEFMRGKVDSGGYVELEPGAFERAHARILDATAVTGPQLRFVIRETPIWCLPSTEGLFTSPVDRDFDRNRCAELHPGELVRTLRTTSDSAWTYVAAGHSVGWVAHPDIALEPALDVERARARQAAPQLYLTDDYDDLRHGSSFPLVRHDPQGFTIQIPGVEGPVESTLSAEAPVSLTAWDLTRRRLFEQAFSQLNQPYGWGGRDGHRDCSRYLYDLFALFDVQLGRNSAVQAELGTRSVDLSSLDENAKREAIREAAKTGVVLIYMPGHILLYLGHEDATDYGISALSEYLTPCDGGPDTVHRLDRVAVTTLDLGRGTQRRAFIERITKMAVFEPSGAPP